VQDLRRNRQAGEAESLGGLFIKLGEFIMSSIAPRNLAEKWVLQAGKKSSRKYWSLVYILFVVLWVPLGVYWGYSLLGGRSSASAVLGLSLGVFSCTSWSFLALVYFERRHFYRIIERQDERIAILEQQVNESSQGVNTG